MGDPIPITPLEVMATQLAEALDEAMQRLHNCHRSHLYEDFDWKKCTVSTLSSGDGHHA